MKNAEAILQYCKTENEPVTAKQIISAIFPGKHQSYVNTTINQLVANGKLIRDDSDRPYTVRLPYLGERIPEPKDYSRVTPVYNANLVTVPEIFPEMKITLQELQETEKTVMHDPRYGEEALFIERSFNKFPRNDDKDIIAMKIALVDMTYSTNLNLRKHNDVELLFPFMFRNDRQDNYEDKLGKAEKMYRENYKD